jgi:hypothetical protein
VIVYLSFGIYVLFFHLASQFTSPNPIRYPKSSFDPSNSIPSHPSTTNNIPSVNLKVSNSNNISNNSIVSNVNLPPHSPLLEYNYKTKHKHKTNYYNNYKTKQRY